MSIRPVLLVWQPSLGPQVARDLQDFVEILGGSLPLPSDLYLGQITIAETGPCRESDFDRLDASARVRIVTGHGSSFMSFDLLREVQDEAERMLSDMSSKVRSYIDALMVVLICSSEFTQDVHSTGVSELDRMSHLGGGPEFVRILKLAEDAVGTGNFADKVGGSITAKTLRGRDGLRQELRLIADDVLRKVRESPTTPHPAFPPASRVSTTETAPSRPTIVEASRPTVNVDTGASLGARRLPDDPDVERGNSLSSRGLGGGLAPQALVSDAVEPKPRPTLFEPTRISEPSGTESLPVSGGPSSNGDDSVPVESREEQQISTSSHDAQPEATHRPKWRWWSGSRSEPRTRVESVENAEVLSVESAVEESKAEIDGPSVRRSVNGPLIVEFDSPLNRKVWHTNDWTKIPNSGPSRDFECEFGNVGDLRVIAGSMRGTKHKYYGDPNQDAYAIRVANGHLIVAVSDGVSSAKYSAYSSKYLTDVVARRIQEGLTQRTQPTREEVRQVVQEAVETASAGVSRWRDGELFAPEAPNDTVDIGELAATLTVTIVCPGSPQDKTREVVVAFVGDSPCYVLKGLEWNIKSIESKTGDVIDHATSALPVKEGRPVVLEWVEFDLGESEALLVMTDGIGTSLASGRSAVGRWMAPRVTPLLGPQLESNFFDLISFDRNGEDDDRTLVVVLDVNSTEFVPQEGSHDGSQ